MIVPIILFITTLQKIMLYYIHVVNNFQIMVRIEGPIKCGNNCENVKHQMGDYFLTTCVFSMETYRHVIVWVVKWLRTLVAITMELLEL